MEPERKIERLLRAYAKKRRADAEGAFKLHPAQRRMLQSEIACLRPRREANPFSFWKLLRDRWPVPLGFALIVCLGVVVFLPVPHKPSEQFGKAKARDESSSTVAGQTIAAVNNSAALPTTAAAPASQTDAAELLADNLTTKPPQEKLPTSGSITQPSPALVEKSMNPEVTVAAGSVPAGAPASFAASVVAESAKPSAEMNHAAAPLPGLVSRTTTTTGSVSPAVSQRELRATISAPAKVGTEFKSEWTGNALLPVLKNSQRFIQITAQRTPPVLATFELQQNGSQVSVVDRDGSIYKGVIQPVEQLDSVGLAKAAGMEKGASMPVPRKNQDEFVHNQSPAQNYFFRVSGANRSLKQNVVFAGNLSVISNATANAAQGFGRDGGGGQLQSANSNIAQQHSLSNSRITGTVTIANTNQMEINALPANR